MACCEACAKSGGGKCPGGVCNVDRLGSSRGRNVPNWYEQARKRSFAPMLRRATLGSLAPRGAFTVTRDAGALDTGDVLSVRDPVEIARAEAEAGRAESIRRGVEALVYGRTAGDPATLARQERERLERQRTGTESTGSTEAALDSRDPAAMTDARWSAMGREERIAWINANVRSEELRTRAITDGITGGFNTIRGIVEAEFARRRVEIEQAAQTERARIAADLDGERARLNAEVERARIEVERARIAANLAAGQATSATATPEERARLEAEATAARVRAEVAQREADAAALARSRVEAEAAELAAQARRRWWLGVGAVVLVLGAGGVWVWQRQQRAAQGPRGYLPLGAGA